MSCKRMHDEVANVWVMIAVVRSYVKDGHCGPLGN